MLLFKIIFSVTGDNFILDDDDIDKIILPKRINFDEYQHPNSLRFDDTPNEELGFGVAYFMDKKVFCNQEDDILAFQKAFIDLLEINYDFFKNHGADEFEYFWEIYYDGGQCNFSIFNEEMLNRIRHCNVQFPVSIYLMTTAELEALLLP